MKKEQQIQTMLTMAAGFLAFYLFTHHKWLLITAFTIMLIGIFSDFLSEKIALIWLKIAEFLGNINGKIFLSILFFLILTPIALLAKLFGNQNMELKKENKSHYSVRNHLYTAKDLKNMW